MREFTKAELIVLRKKCDDDLLFFTRLFFKYLTGNNFIVNRHHRKIAKHLDQVDNYELELFNINIPPRFSKTELCAVNFIARGIGRDPSGNYLYITASDELRSQTSVSIRDIVQSSLFKKLYNIELKQDQNSKNLWRTKQGGGLKTATIFGQITGFGAGIMKQRHGKININIRDFVRNKSRILSKFEAIKEEIRTFEGCIVMDDINKTDDSQQENATNDKVSRVVFNTVLSRKNSKDTPIINIQQRAGLSDITAQFMEHYGKDNPKAKFLVMPVISKTGVPLWRWKHDLEDIEKLRTSPKTAHVFETQYMQNPMPQEGVMFVKDEMEFFTMEMLEGREVLSKAGAMDIADTGKDYFSFPGGVVIGNKIYITEWLYTQENTNFTRPRSASIINSNKINHVAIETNNFGLEFFRQLEKEVTSNSKLYPAPAPSNQSKHYRIINKAEYIRKHFVFRSDISANSDYAKALNHLFRYLKDGSFKIDDAPDSLSMLATLLDELKIIHF